MHFEDMELGLTRKFRRTITREALEATIALTGDQGGYHVDEVFAQAAGFRTVITPGILQATLMTQIGGSINFLAREMHFKFLKPVYVGDVLEVTAEVVNIDTEKQVVSFLGQVLNQDGVEVLQVTTHGHLPRKEWGTPNKPPPVTLV